MKAYAVSRYKAPLARIEVRQPDIGAEDVLIAVAATGLNQLDQKVRRGEFRAFLPYVAPFVLGHDVAGTVIEVGPDAGRFTVGDRVFARPRDGRIGTFADRIAVHEGDVALSPASIDDVQAASLPLVALTAWQALVEVADVRPGQKVLVHAGSGGVGTVAIQLAKHLGAEVATTASARNAQFVRDLGADVVIDHVTQDFAAELSGYDVVLDSLGAGSVRRSLRVVRPGGIVVGISGPPTPEFARAAGMSPMLRLGVGALSRRVRRDAARLDARYRFLLMRADGAQLAKVAALVDEGAIRPVVGRVVGFDEIPEALSALGRGVRGKVVARVMA